MGFKLDKLDNDILDLTAYSWYASADILGIPELDSEKIITWARQHTDYTSGNNYAYGIFDEELPNVAVAFVDIVHSAPSRADGRLKMLSISLSPVYSASEIENDADKYMTVIEIYAQAVIGTIALTGNHNSRIVKIFGRNNSLYNLLIVLNERIESKFADRLTAKIESRWLVITAK